MLLFQAIREDPGLCTLSSSKQIARNINTNSINSNLPFYPARSFGRIRAIGLTSRRSFQHSGLLTSFWSLNLGLNLDLNLRRSKTKRL